MCSIHDVQFVALYNIAGIECHFVSIIEVIGLSFTAGKQASKQGNEGNDTDLNVYRRMITSALRRVFCISFS